MNIAFDADGVLYDTEAFELEYGSLFFKSKYNMELVNEKGYGVKEMFNCSPEQEKEFWTKHAIKYSLFYKPRKNVAEAIKKLRSEGYIVHIITSKAWALDKVKGKIVRLLFETGLKIDGIEVDQIHYCSLENSAYDKMKICENLGIDLMVEDKKENVKEITKVNNVLCMNTNNNQDFECNNIQRVNTFDDIYIELQKRKNNMDKSQSIFNTFKPLSKEERNKLSPSELKEYYVKLREYISSIPFDKKKMEKGERNFGVLYNTLGKTFKTKYKPEVINRELIPEEKGLILVSNHLCNKDMLLILSAIKDVAWHPLIKKEILDDKAGILFKLIESIYVDRKNQRSRKDSTKEMAKILLHNGNVLIFPEGTYNKTENNLLPFDGVSPVYLSQSLDKHIVPIAITKNYNKGERPIVRISEPLKIGVEEDLEEAKQKLWHIINKMVEENKKHFKVKTK